MKRTILALGAAAALGLASTSHAVVYFGKGDVSQSVAEEWLTANHREAGHGVPPFGESVADKAAPEPANTLTNYAGGVGHMLFAPYFTAQDSNQTIFTIVNTDENNGKAVKVRFRSAANSDDLLDFTVLLSPGDVWSASVSQNAAGLLTVNPTEDTTCTLPAKDPNGWTTLAQRLPAKLDAAAKALQTREGYIEVLNMADIPSKFTTAKGERVSNDLFDAIVHVERDGERVPNNCGAKAVRNLLDTETPQDSQELLEGYGLAAPTGGLFGSWWVLNQADLASFSGSMTAIRAEYQGDAAPQGVNAPAQVVFAPQISGQFKPVKVGENTAKIQDLTADPLLTGTYTVVDGEGTYGTPVLKALWYDLPDMSTPILEQVADGLLATGEVFPQLPIEQIETMQLRHASIMNEYTAAPDYDVPMTTDWVVSQPTRRYYAAVDYNTGSVVTNNTLADPGTGEDLNPYSGLTAVTRDDGMVVGCITGIGLTTYDREEKGSVTLAELSGGASQVSCGEVFVMNFGGRSMLRAAATFSTVASQGQAGWGWVGGSGTLPLLGFAATAATNEITKIHYDTTYPHRWND